MFHSLVQKFNEYYVICKTHIGQHRYVLAGRHDGLHVARSFGPENGGHPIADHLGDHLRCQDGVAAGVIPAQHERYVGQQIGIVVNLILLVELKLLVYISDSRNTTRNAALTSSSAMVRAPEIASPCRSFISLMAVR